MFFIFGKNASLFKHVLVIDVFNCLAASMRFSAQLDCAFFAPKKQQTG